MIKKIIFFYFFNFYYYTFWAKLWFYHFYISYKTYNDSEFFKNFLNGTLYLKKIKTIFITKELNFLTNST